MTTGSDHKLGAAAVALLLSALWWSIHVADTKVLHPPIDRIRNEYILPPANRDDPRYHRRHRKHNGRRHTHGAIHHDLSAFKHVTRPRPFGGHEMETHHPPSAEYEKFDSHRNDRHPDSHVDNHPGISQISKLKSKQT